MDKYYYVIHFRYRQDLKSGSFDSEQSCERAALREFENFQRMYSGQAEGPTRYEVRCGSPW